MRLYRLALVAAVSWPAMAQGPVPQGDQFQVNTYTTGFQSSSAVGVRESGDFVVFWETNQTADDLRSTVMGQSFDSDGSPVGGDFEIPDMTTTLSGYRPEVAMKSDGSFVLVWDSTLQTVPYTTSIQARLFDSTGVAQGAQFQVNADENLSQLLPHVSVDAQGNFIVVWRSFGSSGDDTSDSSIQGQRFDAAGAMLGGQFQVNTYTTGYQESPRVASRDDGDFMVTWSSEGSADNDTDRDSIQGRVFDALGSPIGSQFEINTYTTGRQDLPDISLAPDGNFVVVWTSGSYHAGGPDGSFGGIQGQRFDPDGSPEGAEFQVNTFATGRQTYAAVAGDGSAGFVVTWQNEWADGGFPTSIRGQEFSGIGTAVGAEFIVNTYATDLQRWASVAKNDAGRFVIAWTSRGSVGDDTSDYSVQARRSLGATIFADGFESGDVSAWSSVLP
jgi:hypothetical protein